MKEFKRVLRISLYVIGISIMLSSCAKEKTYYADEPNSPSSPSYNKVDICRIGNEVMRLSVVLPTSSSWGNGKLFLSTTTDFSSTPYLTTEYNYSWSSNSSGQEDMYPFYLKPEVDKKYYYYVSNGSDDEIASGSFIMKDVPDILKVKQMTSLSNGVELTLSVPVWFLNIVKNTYLEVYRKGENSSTSSSITYTSGSLDKVNHEIIYNLDGYVFDKLEASTEYNYELKFFTIENKTYYEYWFFSTTTGTGRFTTTAK